MSPQQFDVHVRTGDALSGFGIGPFLVTIEATNHRAAKQDADEIFTEAVVVLPHRKPNEKLERALAAIASRRPATKRDFRGRNSSDQKRAPVSRPSASERSE